MKPTGFDSSVQVNRAQICCYAVETLWNFFASIGGWARFGKWYPRGVFLGLWGTFRFGQYPLGAEILHSNLSNLSWVGIVRAYLILNHRRHFPHSLRFSCHLSLGHHFAQMTFRNCLWSFRDQDRGHRHSATKIKQLKQWSIITFVAFWRFFFLISSQFMIGAKNLAKIGTYPRKITIRTRIVILQENQNKKSLVHMIWLIFFRHDKLSGADSLICLISL